MKNLAKGIGTYHDQENFILPMRLNRTWKGFFIALQRRHSGQTVWINLGCFRGYFRKVQSAIQSYSILTGPLKLFRHCCLVMVGRLEDAVSQSLLRVPFWFHYPLKTGKITCMGLRGKACSIPWVFSCSLPQNKGFST